MDNRNKIYIFLALVIFFIPYSASATPTLSVTPSSLTVNVLFGSTGTFSLNLSNTGSDDLYNLTFSPITGFSFPLNVAIPKNQSKEVTFTVQGISRSETQLQSNMSFYYNVTTTTSPVTYVVTIGSGGFSSQSAIFQQDTITFRNMDSINHTITEIGGGIDQMLAPNQEISVLFSSINTRQFKDNVTNLGISIVTTSNQIIAPAHNPSLDKTFSITYNLLFSRANLSVDSLNPTIVNMSYFDEENGVIILRSNETVYNVRLKNDWFVFEQTDFTMQPNTNKIVPFVIRPQISFETNATNQTYNRIIEITAANADSINKTLPVFIEYYDFGSFLVNGTRFVFTSLEINWSEGVVFCNQNPFHNACANFPTITREVPAQVKFNLSEQDFMDDRAKTTDAFDRMARVENSLVEYELANNNRFSSLENQLFFQGQLTQNQTIASNEILWVLHEFRREQLEFEQFIQNIFIIIIVIIIITGLSFWGYKFYLKNKWNMRV